MTGGNVVGGAETGVLRVPARWPGYAAAVWGFAFAVPSFYWAMGGVTGASSTVAPSLVELAEDGNVAMIATLWVTGALKVVGGLLGLALARRQAWQRPMSRVLQLAGWGAGVLLVWHGAVFVIQGALVEAHVMTIAPDLRTVSRWYTYLWGPWFVLGGIAFILAARADLRRAVDYQAARFAGIVGGLGALALSVVALLAALA